MLAFCANHSWVECPSFPEGGPSGDLSLCWHPQGRGPDCPLCGPPRAGGPIPCGELSRTRAF